jgi:hypothetical protein
MFGMLIDWPEAAWRDFASRAGYLPNRVSGPPVDPDSDVGRLISQHGFIARDSASGRRVLFADALQVPRNEIAQLEERYGLQIGQYPSHRDPSLRRLLEFRIVDPARARALFRTRARTGPIHADTPSQFFNQQKRK